MAPGTMTPDRRAILLEALAQIAVFRPIEHRAYGCTLVEIRQRVRDTRWASTKDMEFSREREFLAAVAQEALDGQHDDALILDAIDALADQVTHDEWDAVSPLKARFGFVFGDVLARGHCANIARRALLACGLPSKPVTSDPEMIEGFVAEHDARITAAHAALRERVSE